MRNRILTAIVGIPIVMLALFGSPIIAEIFLTIIGAGMVYEYLKLVDRWNPVNFGIFMAIIIGLIALAALITPLQFGILMLILWLIAAIAHWGLKQPLWNNIGLLYICVPLSIILSLRLLDDGRSWIVVLLAATWATDTMALFGGRAFGKTKMAPVISPKKTWEGTIIGVISGFAATILAGVLLKLMDNHAATIVLAAILLPPLGVIGDLVESKIKRVYGKKDAGSILPGHGGLLDRVDSLIFTAIGLWCLILFTIPV